MSDPSDNALSGLPAVDPEAAGLSRAGLAALGATMRREIAAMRLPGIAMAISRGGRIAHAESIGAMRPDGPPVRADTIFRIYSMTKPIVSVALMQLVEEGRLLISEPISKYVPELSDPKVGVERGGRIELVPIERPITIHDLLRHTSGLTYGFTGASAVQRLYAQAPLRREDIDAAGFIGALAELPLLSQPGRRWDYSHSTDVLGHLIQIVTGETLGDHLRRRIFEPLKMVDTGFAAPPEAHERLAEPYPIDPDTGAPVMVLTNTRRESRFPSGGGGLVSTLADYLRFVHMLAGAGSLDGVRIIGRKTLSFMTSDHLGPHVAIGSELLPPGHGFGLGFAVRLENGMASTPGTVGEFYWGGIAGTVFWVAPREELSAVMMIQAPGQREYYRQLFRNLVHAALA